jgi:ABC-type glutathione transport system ATPase component
MNIAGSSPIISMTDVTKTYRAGRSLLGKSGSRVVALDRSHLDINAGEIFGLVGESGSGKTTASRLIVGLEAPDDGRSSLTGRTLWASRGGRGGNLPSRFR